MKPIVSKKEGCRIAHQAHMKLIDFYLKNTEGRNIATAEFLERGMQAGLAWGEDATASNAYRKMVKQLAQAQVLWLEPFMAKIIKQGADRLFEIGMETGQWATISPDELALFDNNILIITEGSIDWIIRGEGVETTAPLNHVSNRQSWKQILKNHLMVAMKHSGNVQPLEHKKSFPLVSINFDGTPVKKPDGEIITVGNMAKISSVTAWNYNEEMSVIPDVELDQLVKELKIKKEGITTSQLPTWLVSEPNALVRCAIRSLLDYIQRKGRNELSELEIPYRTLKTTNRKIVKSGFNPNLWKPTIKIIDLPRKPYNPTASVESGRRLTCQHIVEQHIRQQHYSSLGPAYLDDDKTIFNPKSHKAILVPSYIKGPEYAPFKEFDKVVYAVTDAA